MTENERVKVLRKARGLTLEKFGRILGIQSSGVSKIERGETRLTEQNLRAICREFNVREEWLREGLGPMDREADTLDDLADRYHATELERSLLRAYFQLDAATRAAVMAKLTEIFASATPEQRARRRADAFYEEALAEEQAAAASSASPPSAGKEAKEA